MRRSDREVTDETVIDEIINSCDSIRLGMCDGNIPYVVPLSFGYRNADGRRTFFFHCAKVGRKLDIISKFPKVCFELDSGYEIKPSDKACGYTAAYKSIIGYGNVSVVEEPEKKEEAMQTVMKKYSGRDDWSFNEAQLMAVCVLKLDVTELSCKVHL